MTARGWFVYRYLDDVANLYRERGFEVLVAPRSTQLPFNHGNFLPDILAWPNGHYIAVELKFSLESYSAESRELPSLTDEVNKYWPPGSSVDLHRSPFPPVLPNIDVILRRLAAAQELRQSHEESAFLIAFSSLEGAMLGISTLGNLPSRPDPIGIAQVLRDDGFLADSGFGLIYDLARLRNSLAHGTLSDVSEVSDRLGDLLDITRRILVSRQAKVFDVLNRIASTFEPTSLDRIKGGNLADYDLDSTLHRRFDNVKRDILGEAAQILQGNIFILDLD